MSTLAEKDIYYLKIAKTVSLRSKCLSRKIGAVLVKDDSLIGAGFNGPSRGVKHCNERPSRFYLCLDKNEEYNSVDNEVILYYKNCPRRSLNYKSGQGLHLCQAGHAERNALIQAARNGVSTLNTTLYCWCSLPCLPCMIEIINSGVTRLIYIKGNDYDDYSRTIMKEARIEYTEYEKELL